MPANFAAHPPENANTTEPRVLRASNGPDPRNRINTERRISRVKLARVCNGTWYLARSDTVAGHGKEQRADAAVAAAS
jgi:hypothetical protein